MKYTLRTDKVYSEDNKAFTVYGIAAESSHRGRIKSIADIFFNKTKAENFISLCNKNQLSTVHLKDVVNDVIESM